MALSAEDAAWLAELKAARRKLLLGEKMVSISSGGRAWSVQESTLEQIDAEIDRLEAADKTTSGVAARRGAIRFNW
jgi:hypothetical protein